MKEEEIIGADVKGVNPGVNPSDEALEQYNIYKFEHHSFLMLTNIIERNAAMADIENKFHTEAYAEEKLKNSPARRLTLFAAKLGVRICTGNSDIRPGITETI